MPDLPYAEVIGDPIAHSRSPAIHRSWLRALEIEADYRATAVPETELRAYLAGRRRDPLWRGCNVTAPHKQKVIEQLDRLDPFAGRVGAVNCILRQEEDLVGFNTDVDGIGYALADVRLRGARAVIIGTGGAARAAVAALEDEGAAEIQLLARSPDKAQQLAEMAPGLVRVRSLTEAPSAISGATVIVNASPAGMARVEPMPGPLLQALNRAAAGATVLEMVYEPLETPLLTAARTAGLRTVDGLTMLLGQARRAFELFFERSPPAEAVIPAKGGIW